MGPSQYIERQLLYKNLGTYFRRGKWFIHVLLILFFMFVYVIKYTGRGPDKLFTLERILTSISLTLPFIAFFYTYCIYLIPFCFKRNKYKQFWILLGAALVVFPFIDYLLQRWAMHILPRLEESMNSYTPWFVIARNYFKFITSFVGFSALLYFMELLESVNIDKETAQYEQELTATELRRIKTQMNPEFMIRSLDGIIQLAENADSKAPDAVVDFSDVLRYRLYRSKERLVLLSAELAQLENLFAFHNALPGQQHTCTLETEGAAGDESQVVPLSLINIAEPLLTTFRPGTDWSMLMYLLVETDEIQVAVELTGDDDTRIVQQAERIHKDLEQLLYSGLTFTTEKDQNNFSLRICIPIIRNLTASS